MGKTRASLGRAFLAQGRASDALLSSEGAFGRTLRVRRASEARSSAPRSDFAAILARSDRSRGAPGIDFPRFSCRFSRFFVATGRAHEKRPTSTKHWQERYRTHFGASARQAENVKNRSADAPEGVRRHERAPRALRDGPGPPRGRSWSVPGRSWSAPGRSWSVPGCSWSAPGRAKSGLGPSRARLGPLRGRPARVPGRPRIAPGRPRGSKIDFGATFARFSVTSGSIFLGFSRFGWGSFAAFDVLAHRGVRRAQSLAIRP